MNTRITTLIDCPFQEGKEWKWREFVDGHDGYLYGIPFMANRVLKFCRKDEFMTEIGPEFNDHDAWWCGIFSANHQKIYCPPISEDGKFLIIDIENQIVSLLDHPLPETNNGSHYLWRSGALAADGNIYFMPYRANKILKLNTTDDTLSTVGNDFSKDMKKNKFGATVVSHDGTTIYGLPCHEDKIIKYNIMTPNVISIIGEGTFNSDIVFTNAIMCPNNTTIIGLDRHGQILLFNTLNDAHMVIEGRLYHDSGNGWGDAIIGSDQNIYWPPQESNKVLKFDLSTKKRSLIGDDFSDNTHYGQCKWSSGCIPSDDDKSNNGFAYFIPDSCKYILKLDTRVPKSKYQKMKNNLKRTLTRSK